MKPGKYVGYNGEIYSADRPIIFADNSVFKSGYGFFDTLLLIKEKIVLEAYHFSRWKNSIKKLFFLSVPGFEIELKNEIIRIAKKNHTSKVVRVRIDFFTTVDREPSSAYPVNFIIQTYSLNAEALNWETNGIPTGLFSKALKIRDEFSHLKTNNRLCYVAASNYAILNNWKDSIILNESGNIVETTIANIFLIKNDQIFTPPLSEGCVEGTMRKHLMEELKKSGKPVIEKPISKNEFLKAEEVFITNAIIGMRAISSCGNHVFILKNSRQVFQSFIEPLYH